MKFDKIIKEYKIQLTSNTTLAKRLRDYRGINFIILGETEPPDVHGIPSELEAYGRGGIMKNGQIWLDGGANGSSNGHPTFIKEGFYWGADYDAIWIGSDNKKRKGIIYIRGRAGTNEDLLKERLEEILALIFKKLPRNYV